MGGPDVEYAAVALDSPYDILRIGTAVGAENSYMEPVGVQEAKGSFESVRLMEFHWSVPVTVLNVDDDTVYGHDTGEIAESMLVRAFGIILLRFDENVVEIHIDGLTLPEQPHLHVEFHQQFVQL